jgi:L-cysteine/cystine lyase
MSPPASERERTAELRAQFPVFERLTYMNAGTEGPVPRQASEAVQERAQAEATVGRCGRSYFEETQALAGRLRSSYADVLGCSPSEVALTGSTTDGCNTVLGGLDLHEGDEILTSDEEHPGLLAPLGRAKRAHGISVRVVAFDELASAVTEQTRLVACSHVSWVSGRVVDAPAIKATGVSLLLDGAQGIGAVAVDVRQLGCDFYAGSGQKWLCGPEGSGCLYVRKERIDDLLVPWPGYGSLADPHRALDFEPADGAARFDHGYPAGLRSVYALASLKVFDQAGWSWVHSRAAGQADLLAQKLSDQGLTVWPRGSSTLVSWEAGDAQAVVERLAEENVVVRSIPAHGLVRASVGAWTSGEDIDRLVSLAADSA